MQVGDAAQQLQNIVKQGKAYMFYMIFSAQGIDPRSALYCMAAFCTANLPIQVVLLDADV